MLNCGLVSLPIERQMGVGVVLEEVEVCRQHCPGQACPSPCGVSCSQCRLYVIVCDLSTLQSDSSAAGLVS